MSEGSKRVRFVWWNAQDFAHFDISIQGERWPDSKVEYDEKCRRVDGAFAGMSTAIRPDLIGLAEITCQAAEDLRARVFPTYRLHAFVDTLRGRDDSDHRIAVLFNPAVGFEADDYLVVPAVPRTTREILHVDLVAGEDRIRFYFAHLTARFHPSALKTRRLASQALSHQLYDFLDGAADDGRRRHVVILGDLYSRLRFTSRSV